MNELHDTDPGDGARIAYRVFGEETAPALVLLHATLSTSGQLLGLARLLAAGGHRVLVPDRRGSGASRLEPARQVPVTRQVDDALALLDAEGIARAALVGHSFGGVVALELAARAPERVRAVVAFEPPYVAVAGERERTGMEAIGRATDEAFLAGGRPAAARAFMTAISSAAAWEALPKRTRAFLESEGGGAYADAGMGGLAPDALGGITAPVTLLAGTRSEPFYRPLARALADRIPGARLRVLDGLAHTSPITEPALVAPAILEALASWDASAASVPALESAP